MQQKMSFWQDEFSTWGSSSVDFCEENFETSVYVAEPFNTISAAPLIGLGLIGFSRCGGFQGGENISFALLFLTLVAVGVGTVMLHATLTAVGQACDEIPMLILTVGLVSTILDAEYSKRPPWLLPATFLAMAGVIVLYLHVQHMYVAFLSMYSLLVACIIAKLASWSFVARDNSKSEAVRKTVIKPLFLYGIGSYIGAGVVAWCTDMAFCDTVSKLLFGGLFLHPLWHLGSALGTWFAIYAVMAARDDLSGRKTPSIVWLANVLPCVDESANSTRRQD